MPVDVAAEVIANHPLSADYNVLAPARTRDRPDRGTRTVRDGEGGARARPAAAAAIFRVRDPPRPGRRACRLLAAEQAHRSVNGSRLQRRTGTARRLPGTARPSVFARRGTDRGVDGGGRRRAGAVRHARRVASRARRALHSLLRGTAGRGVVLSESVSGSRRRSRSSPRRMAARASTAASPPRSSSVSRHAPRPRRS